MMPTMSQVNNLLRRFEKALPVALPFDHNLRFLNDIYNAVKLAYTDPDKNQQLYQMLLDNVPPPEIEVWFAKNIPDYQTHLDHYKNDAIEVANCKLMHEYDASLPHTLLALDDEARFVHRLYFQHRKQYGMLEKSPEKNKQLYLLLSTKPHYKTIVGWFNDNVADWKEEYASFCTCQKMLEATDAFILQYEKNISFLAGRGSDSNKVVHLYNHYRKLCEGYLGYSYDVHRRFYELTLTGPRQEKVIEWFSRNVSEWNRTDYGMTNGRVDWQTGGCFADSTRILMADGTTKDIQNIRRGDEVMCGEEKVRVECLVEWTRVMECVSVGDLLITPWHPIRLDGEWVFPYDTAEDVRTVTRDVYNLVLDKGHVVTAEGIEACTLGHGFTDNEVIKHAFYGTSAVVEELKRIDPEGWERGCVRGSGVVIEGETITGMIYDGLR
jgi:hypothetical protein